MSCTRHPTFRIIKHNSKLKIILSFSLNTIVELSMLYASILLKICYKIIPLTITVLNVDHVKTVLIIVAFF